MGMRVLRNLGIALVALLVASATAAAKITYEKEPFKLLPGTQHEPVTVKCPGNAHVLSGGIGAVWGMGVVVSSMPVDRGDGDEKPDDGWSVVVASPEDAQSDDRIKIHAVCATGPAPKYKIVGTTATGIAIDGATCPAGTQATGAGALTEGAMGVTYVHTWSPYDFGSASGEATQVVVEGSAPFPDVTLAAVCTDKLDLRYRKDTFTIESPFGAPVPVFCMKSEEVVGGGGFVADPGPGVTVKIEDSFPDDRPGEPGHRPEDAWGTSFLPDPFSAEPTAAVVAVCAK